MKIGLFTNAPVLFGLGLADLLSRYAKTEVVDKANAFGFMYENEDSSDETWFDVSIRKEAANSDFSLIVNPEEDCDRYIVLFRPYERDVDRLLKLMDQRELNAENTIFISELKPETGKYNKKAFLTTFRITDVPYAEIPLSEKDILLDYEFRKELNIERLSAGYRDVLLYAFNFVTNEDAKKIKKITFKEKEGDGATR